MKRSIALFVSLLAAAIVATGCGGDDQTAGTPATTTKAAEPTVTETTTPPVKSEADGVKVVVEDSEFGPMLMDAKKQAIYIFENDSPGESACYGECAEAWPPVLTSGQPVAGGGVRSELLGTTERRDGEMQVTYDGKPLYFYAHESPGEVLCHNVDLNGGLWWVIGPNGKRRP